MIEDKILERVVASGIGAGADFVELFCERTLNTSISFLDGKVENVMAGEDYGCGVRVFFGLESAYAYTSDTTEAGLSAALAAAVATGSGGDNPTGEITVTPVRSSAPQTVAVNPAEVTSAEKVDFLRAADAAARAHDELIKQVQLNLVDKVRSIRVVNSDGVAVDEEQTYVRAAVSAIAESGGERQTGHRRIGGLGGFEVVRDADPLLFGVDAARVAAMMIRAEYAPAATMPVVVGAGDGGVIFHEACGHSLEATSVAKKASVFADKMGQPIAAECVTAVDDGTIHGLWGSIGVDDEGEEARRTVLIENGVLKNFLTDRMNARRMGEGTALSGSARRSSYRFAPTSRMRNTFIDNGDSKFDDIISGVDYGLYAKAFGGGSVNPATGRFNFGVREAYMIRGGRIAEPVRGALLIGYGSDVLKNIAAVADDLDHEIGMCGSSSGWVPVTVGQPSILVSKMVVGGREGEKASE